MGRKLDEDDVIHTMCQRIVGVSEERARIVASYIPSAEPSASDCWACNCPRMSNDNKTTDDSIDTNSSRYGTDRTTDGLIRRHDAIDAMANTLWHYPNECYRNLNVYEFARGLAELGLKSVPTAQPDLDEWCNTCREYDSEKHCCPRYNRVIREAVEEVKKDRIKCVHCKRYDSHGHRCKWWNHGVSNVDWCSYGKRKEEE